MSSATRPRGGRVRRGFRLAAESWAVLRADRSLALFPIVGFAAGVAAALILAAPGVAVASLTDQDWVAIPFLVLAAYAATFVALYCGVALAAAAAQAMDGRDTTLADGFAAARARRGVIAKWAAVQLTVGLLLNLVQGLLEDSPIGKLAASIITGLVGAAWAIATFFIVPVLAFERIGPKDALKRSFHLVRERWGEGVVGSASISGVVFLVALLPIAALVVLAVAIGGAGGVAVGVVAALVLVAAMVLGTALSSVFRVALYRYAVDGTTGSVFADDDLAHAFRPKRRKR